MSTQPERTGAIRAAAGELVDAMAMKTSDLADEILGRPQAGSAEWQDQWATRHTAAGRRRMQEWYLVKLEILREARLGPVGAVVNARAAGASWEAIGEACGVTAAQAEQLWGPCQSPEVDAERKKVMDPSQRGGR
jgi:hypothetical protein